MSNYLDMEQLVSKIEVRWGPNQKSWLQWEKLADDFAPYTAGAMFEALELLYRSGIKTAPSSSEMMRKTAEVQALRYERGVDEMLRTCSGQHVWANPFPTDKDRRQMCVLCGELGGIVPCDHTVRTESDVCVYCLKGAPVS